MSVEKKEVAGSARAALDDAQSIVEAAKTRAVELTAKAEQLHAEAKVKGYQEGFERGLEEASRKAVRFIEESTAVADTLAEEAARLALAIAGSVIGEHIEVTPEAAKRIAVKAIQDSVVGDSICVLIHPDDEGRLRKAMSDLKKVAGGAGVSIETDSALTRGGCIVRTDFGEVDATIETLLASVSERLGLSNNGQ